MYSLRITASEDNEFFSRRPALHGRAHRRNYFRQQDLTRCAARTPLASVLGPTRRRSWTARNREVALARRHESLRAHFGIARAVTQIQTLHYAMPKRRVNPTLSEIIAPLYCADLHVGVPNMLAKMDKLMYTVHRILID